MSDSVTPSPGPPSQPNSPSEIPALTTQEQPSPNEVVISEVAQKALSTTPLDQEFENFLTSYCNGAKDPKERAERLQIADQFRTARITKTLFLNNYSLVSSISIPPQLDLLSLNIHNCSNLVMVQINNSENLKELTIRNSPKIQTLNLPSSQELRYVDLYGCKKLEELTIPDISKLHWLCLSFCDSLKKPIDITNCPNLRNLDLSHYPHIIHADLSKCPNLEYASLSDCTSLTKVSCWRNPCLYELHLERCTQPLEVIGLETLSEKSTIYTDKSHFSPRTKQFILILLNAQFNGSASPNFETPRGHII